MTIGVAAVLATSMLGRIEWYPLTNIPMYSSYVDGEEISGIPMATFGDEGLLDDLARTDGALAVGDGRTRLVLGALHRQLGVDGELTLSDRFADDDVDLLSVGGDP